MQDREDAADLALLSEAVRESAAIARRLFGQPVKSWHKAKDAPVSEADIAINTLLHERLRGARPDYGWLSEETEDDSSRLTQRRVFVVDPIDGTVAFLKGKPEFTICAGVIVDGRPRAAAVFNPMTDEFFSAQLGAGAHLNGAPLRVSAREQIEGARMVGPRALYDHPSWAQPWPPLHIENRGSIAYRMALVAAGQFDGMLSLYSKHDWDIAAAELLVTEAGGIATTHRGETLSYNGAVARQRSIICSGPQLYPLLLERVRHLSF
ncbi:MAG: 3'(2'),5'-bisphosphate nucleotidase CysQ [Alphaproteobacteria bacterium]|nr:3'(2'),5'-bisphosphate nucleotidase CysQ [Alphaproteobacteria bacterium]